MGRRARPRWLAPAALLLAALALPALAAGEAGIAPERDDLACDATLVRRANHDHLRKILSELVNTTYFRLFRVQLDGECPLRPGSGTAGKPPVNAAVQAANAAAASAAKPGSTVAGFGMSSLADEEPGCTAELFGSKPLCELESEQVDKTISEREDIVLSRTQSDCDDDGLPSFWLDLCAELPFHDESKEYINLKLNPETYTGYNGSDVWAAIYKENCFDDRDAEVCYEEQFLYRLLSGLHSSINLHIAKAYYPPKKGVRESWEPNLERFKSQFLGHDDRFKNLQFAFVVLLRAARKAASVLEKLNYKAFNPEETFRTQALVKIFLDSHVLSSCQGLFEAFDESLLFGEQDRNLASTMSNLKRRFKGVFHNISRTFNCVKCQKCRLHGKLQLLGIGTAIKILLVPDELIRENLIREEVVALFNTLEKLSESLEIYDEMTKAVVQPSTIPVNAERSDRDLVDASLFAVAEAARDGRLTPTQEDQLVDAALDHDHEVLLLAKHFIQGGSTASFLRHALRRLGSSGSGGDPSVPDVVIIGAGLSGLTATLSVLDRGGSVVLIDKEAVAGGNSAKASSGINAIDDDSARLYNDSVAIFREDVLRGSHSQSNPLVDVLTEGSVEALQWLRTRVGLPLEEVGQLGGHSRKRTRRPSTGLAGSEMIAGLNKALKDSTKGLAPNRFAFHKKTKVTSLLTTPTGEFRGVECLNLVTNESFVVEANAVIIATGGYGFHHSPGALLNEVRPDLAKFATTNGAFATGDGIRLAADRGAATIDIDQVQVHPTAFVDPKNRTAPVKTLAAELLRGVGAVILGPDGRRFVDELGTRKFVSEKMMSVNVPGSAPDALPEFLMVLNQEAANKAPKHIPMYLKKGLLVKFTSIAQLAKHAGVEEGVLADTFAAFDRSAADPAGSPDAFGRTVFESGSMSSTSAYYAGWIQPAVHYSMGGLRIDADGHILDTAGSPLFDGRAFAIGETTGGIHGENRLGGNALTECTVFGRHVGRTIPLGVAAARNTATSNPNEPGSSKEGVAEERELPQIDMHELEGHASRESCWVALHDNVYDFTDFIDEHPGAPEAITNICGKEANEEFDEVHSLNMLEDFDPIGTLKECEEKCGVVTTGALPF